MEQIDDHWYQGEDCVDPSRIAPPATRAILPAADGTLALKRDVAIPGASRGCTRYKTHDLERRLTYEKSVRVEGKLLSVSPMELIACHQKQKELFAADEFWWDEIRDSLYVPGPDDTPVNFAYRTGPGRKLAIPYRVAAPMAWEYPYAHGQLQESLTDRLVTASLYGFQLVRPGYGAPQCGPETFSEAEWQRRKPEACTNYVLDTDTSSESFEPPQGSIGITSNGEEAFECREEGCEAMPGMPCYFATAEQYTAHWNTFHVAVAPTMTCMVRGCGVKFPPGPDSLDAFFRHCKEKHEAESDGGKWGRLRNWARKGIDLGPNRHYWAPTREEPLFLSRPSPQSGRRGHEGPYPGRPLGSPDVLSVQGGSGSTRSGPGQLQQLRVHPKPRPRHQPGSQCQTKSQSPSVELRLGIRKPRGTEPADYP